MSKNDQDFDPTEPDEMTLPTILARLTEAQRAEIMRQMQEVIRKEKNHRQQWQAGGHKGEPESAIISERKKRIESKMTKRLGVTSIDLTSGNN
ncbi:MAG: hypothetical protein ORN98_05230 [Alphaproteobacteria bacterium]|nr:hypothetical protein [Alphaproteobacteria bacterium]